MVLDLSFQVRDPLLLGGMVRPCFLLEGSSPVLEEFLLPAVEDRRLESYPSHQPKTILDTSFQRLTAFPPRSPQITVYDELRIAAQKFIVRRTNPRPCGTGSRNP